MASFSRKNNGWSQLLNWIIFLSGFCLIYIGLFRLFWLWNLITLPAGLLISIIGYVFIYRARRIIKQIEFSDTTLIISLMNGKKRIVARENLEYALLIKYYANPVRAIKLKDRSKSIKTIGVLKASGWKNSTQEIASYLIKEKYQRRPWDFGFSAGEIILSIALLLGLLEITQEGMLEAAFRNAGAPTLADLVVESSAISHELKQENIQNSRKAEKDYFEEQVAEEQKDDETKN